VGARRFGLGVVRFQGEAKSGEFVGVRVGVELDTPTGKNDGRINGEMLLKHSSDTQHPWLCLLLLLRSALSDTCTEPDRINLQHRPRRDSRSPSMARVEPQTLNPLATTLCAIHTTYELSAAARSSCSSSHACNTSQMWHHRLPPQPSHQQQPTDATTTMNCLCHNC
jgi:hypothetical protein